MKYKNLDIHFKEKSKTKEVNVIKITGVPFSEKNIEDKIENISASADGGPRSRVCAHE